MTDRADQFAPLAPERLAQWSNFANWKERTYFPQFLGFKVEEMKVDYSRMSMPFRPELEQPAGAVHGGAIASLLDTCVVPAIGTAYENRRAFFTLDFHIRYMVAAIETDIVAEGWVRRRGRSIVFCEAEALDPSGQVLAAASLTYKLGREMTPPV